jgi:hypothetical protein
MRKPRIGRLIQLQWKDIQASTAWEARTVDGLALCQSVGWVSGVTRDQLSIVSTRGQDDAKSSRETLQRITIPIGCVISWAYLS